MNNGPNGATSIFDVNEYIEEEEEEFNNPKNMQERHTVEETLFWYFIAFVENPMRTYYVF